MAEVPQNFETEVVLGDGEFTPITADRIDPDTGPYTIEVANAVPHAKEDGKVSIQMDVVITEPGNFQGGQVSIYIGTDWSKEFNVRHLKTMLVSTGADPAKMKGKLKVNAPLLKALAGRKGFIYIRKAMDGEVDETSGRKKLADCKFQTQAQYEQAKKAQQIAGGQQPAAPRSAPAAGQQPAPTPAAASAGGAVDLGDMFPK